MNALAEVKLSQETLKDIAERPGEYPIEMVGAALDVISEMSRQLYEAKTRLSGHILSDMVAENATKMQIVGQDGERKVITLKKGKMDMERGAESKYAAAGFPLDEIGEYVFKPSWTKAKEQRKLGGVKQLVIDEIFTEGKPSLTIEEAK
jgi:hypothetical protein